MRSSTARLILIGLMLLAWCNTVVASDHAPANKVLTTPPENPDPSQHYLFYLHGRIVEGSDGSPVSPDYGPYEYFDIVGRFSQEGFVTISEIREEDADVPEYAEKVSDWIRQLLSADVPPSRITVVGASKGGVIASHVSHRLRNQEIRYVFLAGLFASLFEKADVRLFGKVLSIHDKNDKFTVSPELFFDGSPGITTSKSIVTETGLGHGLLYKAYPEWFDETVRWTGLETEAAEDSAVD